jgi:hypothetical protein
MAAAAAALFLAPLAAAQDLRQLEGVKLYVGCLRNDDATKIGKLRQLLRLTLVFHTSDVYFLCL